jgi:hypothetical protein
VDDLHGVRRVADGTRAFSRFCDLATIDVDLDCMVTDGASEEGISHVWDNGGGSDNETFDSDDLVNI